MITQNTSSKVYLTIKQEKVSSAKIAMSDVLRNGGSLQDARNAYHDALQIPRSDMIKLVKNLNVQSGFSDPEIQRHFDENGKLPRYADEQESIISFADFTTSAKNLNSSVSESNVESSESSDAVISENSESSLIQKLLDEIQSLKNQIKLLEERQSPIVQNMSLLSPTIWIQNILQIGYLIILRV